MTNLNIIVFFSFCRSHNNCLHFLPDGSS